MRFLAVMTMALLASPAFTAEILAVRARRGHPAEVSFDVPYRDFGVS